MVTGERLEYLLPCGHRSAGLACFQCAVEEYLAADQAARRLEPAMPVAIPRELTITVACPPHVQRFTARRRWR